MAKYVIVKMIESQTIGSTFNSGKWPLHVTIIPNFEIKWDYKKLNSELEAVVNSCSQVRTVANTDDLFGPDKDIPVTRLELRPELAKIHTTIVEFLENNDAKFELPIILKENYKPHITIQGSARVNTGDSINIDELSIVDKEVGGNSSLRKVLGVVKLTK